MLLMAKEIRINVRTSAETKRDLKIAAKLRGITPSSLVNFAVTQIIREEKERDPAAFKTTTGLPAFGAPFRTEEEIRGKKKKTGSR
jgi:hypothetical protein